MQSSKLPTKNSTCPCSNCGDIINNSTVNFITRNNAALHFKSQHIDVKVDNCIAKISIKQVFVNLTDSAVEGTYMFPMETNVKSTTFSKIKFQLGDKEIKSKIVHK
jgi:pentose-5-phosphate-3-epimerase